MRNSLAYTKLEFKAPKKWLMCLIFLCPSLFICMQPLRECVCKQRFKPTPQRYSSVSKKISWENFGQCGSRVLCAELCNKNHCLQPGACVGSHLCLQVLSTSKNFIWPIVLPSLGVLWNSRDNSFYRVATKFTSVSEPHVHWEDSLDDTSCKLDLIKSN